MILQFKSVKLCRKYRWNVVYYNSEYIYTACVCYYMFGKSKKGEKHLLP